jgi:serine O-acetyltransferase
MSASAPITPATPTATSMTQPAPHPPAAPHAPHYAANDDRAIAAAIAPPRTDLPYEAIGAKDPDWAADLLRYPARPFLREQSSWALWVYRFGRRNDRRRPGFVRRVNDRLYWLLFRVTETLTGISIPKGVEIGPGLRIWHFGNIFVHKDVKIGARCTLRQGVTIGVRMDDGPVPVLGDDVNVGAYAQILGGIYIGNGAKIGAMSVVLQDVPAGATAVGVPARVVGATPGSPGSP